MEAARVAAIKGHDVTLYEKSNRLGGQLIAAYSLRSKQYFVPLWNGKSFSYLN